MKTYYDILEVSRYASDEVIKRAHKVLIKKYHPDLKGTESAEEKKEAERKTIEINEAYEVLTDPIRKEKYDKFLDNQEILNKNKQNTSSSSSNNAQNMSGSTTSKSGETKKYDERAAESAEIEIANQKLKEEVDKRVNQAQENIDKEQEKIRMQMQNDYANYLRRLGYKVKDTRPFKEKMRSYLIIALAILILFAIFSIMYKIPSIYIKIEAVEESNFGVKIISRIIKTIVDLIWSIFGL